MLVVHHLLNRYSEDVLIWKAILWYKEKGDKAMKWERGGQENRDVNKEEKNAQKKNAQKS